MQIKGKKVQEHRPLCMLNIVLYRPVMCEVFCLLRFVFEGAYVVQTFKESY